MKKLYIQNIQFFLYIHLRKILRYLKIGQNKKYDQMKKYETIEFILKYNDCLYYVVKYEKAVIDDYLLETLRASKNIISVFEDIGKEYKIFSITYSNKSNILDNSISRTICYVIDIDHKNLIDRKSKILNITQKERNKR